MNRVETIADLRSTARTKDRNAAWRLAGSLGGRDLSVWRLEAVKAAIALSEEQPGNLADENSTSSALKLWRQTLFVTSAVTAACLFLLWYLRFGLINGAGRIPVGASRLMAVHGELATRTRHMFSALPTANPPFDVILLLGRLRHIPRSLKRTLPKALGLATLPPLVLPLSPRAVAASIADWPGMLIEGLKQAINPPYVRDFREATGIAFRVCLGCAQARWWKRYGPNECELVLGLTGTADTTLLERAVQESGGKTVHVVHGQATGPNFAGISNLALFRSGHDASAYGLLGTYGRCEVQPAVAPDPMQRSGCGLLLLTNLAHPMNAEYRQLGPTDEIALIRCVGQAARLIGDRAQPLLWKPHPTLYRLPDAAIVRRAAQEEGFSELPVDTAIAEAAAQSRWVVSSPSTVALDLMQAGILCLIVDPQGSLTDTAISALPACALNSDSTFAALVEHDDDKAYADAFSAAFDQIRPAAPITLNWQRN